MTGMASPSRAVQELYANGARAWRERTPRSLNHALDAFNAALSLEPDHAPSHAGLAITFLLLREYTQMPDAQAYPLAAAAARQAVAIDETLPEAHAALAFVEYWGHWDAEASERAFQLAISLGPDWATGHHWYANFLAARGRVPEAIAEIDRALEVDPQSLSLQADRALLLFHAGRVAAAVTDLERLARLGSGFASPHRYLANIYLIEARDADFLREARLVADLVDDPTQLAALDAAGVALASGGRPAMLEALIADRSERARSGAVSAYSVAWLRALAGDADGALAWLQTSLVKREADFVGIVFDPILHRAVADASALKALASQVAPVIPRRFNSTRGVGAELAAMLDRAPDGMMLLDPEGRLRFANLAAERMLREPGGLRVAAGRLSAARTEDAKRLQALVERAAVSDGEGFSGGVALWTSSRQAPLSLTVTTVRPDRSPTRGACSVLVCVTDLEADITPPIAQMRELYGLTPAEARLALALFEGLTPTDAAKHLGISRNTVQAQLARIFDKTGAARQSGLMRLMMRLAGAGRG
jgi:DNA-binding CsgD family transcriptional regulator/tetratricopeptide (TPR) repeat protein